MAKGKAPANLGDWFDRGEERKLDRLLGKWLKEHGDDPCRTTAWKYMLVDQFRCELEDALGHPHGWLRRLTVDEGHFGDDPRLVFPSVKAAGVLDGVMDWTVSDFSTDIFGTSDVLCRGEFLTALFWCTGYEDGSEGIDLGV